MRQPLRHQIMFPMLGLMLATLVGVSLLNAYLAAERAKHQIEEQLDEIILTLDRSNFPLTDAVLQQMRGLSGAEFVLMDPAGEVLAASADRGALASLPRVPTAQADVVLRQRITLGEATYFHVVKQLGRQHAKSPIGLLHILYPVAGYRDAWTDAVFPPLVIGLAAVLLVVLSAAAVAARVIRPITRLQAQVERIAEGDFRPLPLPDRRDEILDLAQSINQMAAMLTEYEHRVRQTERLRTLAQLGGGIAHQMRNAATGCRIALDLLADEQALPEDCENLVVAQRQLELMERYLQRFLTLGKPLAKPQHHPVDLVMLIQDLLPLVRPAARHAGVDLQWQTPAAAIIIQGDSDGLEQLMINLLLNGIEAASQTDAASAAERVVRLVLEEDNGETVEISVLDSGVGPTEDVQGNLFEPFVTSKADGTGLGLSVAQQVAVQHGGEISWERQPETTSFRVKLPRGNPETYRA